MKEELLAQALRVTDIVERTNVARQYLQRQILAALAVSGAFQSLAFVGGTCLRFFHDLRRYSEDLDFSVETAEGYEPLKWMESIRLELVHQGFQPEVSWRTRHAVDFGWVKLSGLQYELGVAGTRDQRLSIKLEADRNPPAGARCQTTALTSPRLMAVRHYDVSSLMAGKINAVLSRPYAKGRDWYDLLWYLARRIEPNPTLLNHGLAQTRSVYCSEARNWREGVASRLSSLDWNSVVRDVRPFLEDSAELKAFTPDLIRAMLEGTLG